MGRGGWIAPWQLRGRFLTNSCHSAEAISQKTKQIKKIWLKMAQKKTNKITLVSVSAMSFNFIFESFGTLIPENNQLDKKF